MHTVEEVKNILNNNKGQFAFLIGNGVNRYIDPKVTWYELLKKAFPPKSDELEIKEDFFKQGISYTEYYDINAIKKYEDTREFNKIKKEIANSLINKCVESSVKCPIGSITQKIHEHSSPILTTNFDQLLEGKDKRFANKHKIQTKGFTDFYPWSVCYNHEPNQASGEDIDILNSFAIWHIHGCVEHSRSIKLGLKDYALCIKRAEQFILDKLHPTHGRRRPLNDMRTNGGWAGDKTWLDIFFNKNLFIFGLSLDENEIFLRWLLIQRMNFMIKEKRKGVKSYYLARAADMKKLAGKKYFLKSVGIEVLELENYDQIYKDIWE